MFSFIYTLINKNSKNFNKRKTSIVCVFTKTKNDLNKLITEQRSYIADLIDKKNKIEYEIDTTHSSVVESEKLIEKIDNFLN